MEIVSGYCQLCRDSETQMYGEVINEWSERHYQACKRGRCKHPIVYVIDKTEKQVFNWKVSEIDDMITSSDFECSNIEEWYEELKYTFDYK
tara:strand:- start:67 stop:339 length:273 start_codon:yes stop_codon:yes gene_type:complete